MKMKNSFDSAVRRRLRPLVSTFAPVIFAGCRFNFWLLLLAVLFMPLAVARADVSLTLYIGHGYDFYYPGVSLNASNPDPVTYDRVESPNGIIWANFGTNNDSNPFYLTNNLDALLAECNGTWKLYLNKEDASEQLYYFTVSITDVTTDLLGDITIIFPEDGSSEVTDQPTFHWTGSTNLAQMSVSAYTENNNGNSYYDSLPVTATNWTPSGPLTPGDNEFYVDYSSDNFAGFSFTDPTNSSGTLPGWTTEGNLFTYAYSFFSVAGEVGGDSGGGHTNLVYYSFEDGDIFATDYSPNGNNVSSISSFGGGTAYTTNTETMGDYAAYFFNNGGSGASWLSPPTNLLATLAGSFSVSLWVNTTQATGSDDDDGLSDNAGLISAFNGPGGNWVVPMAITGNKLAFATGGNPQSTLHSTTDINTGDYVHLVVTRNQATGEKKIYVNGVLDATETGSTDLLDSPTSLDIGKNNGTGFDGRMDEIQIYSGVLNVADVDFLYNNPGSVVDDIAGGGSDFGEALNAPELTWTTGGDVPWFTQTSVTQDGLAAQSGAITDDQSSYLETTVPADGDVSFYWKVSSEDGWDYLTFYINDDEMDSISGDQDWYQEDYEVYAGDVLRWEYSKDSSGFENLDAGFLDQVSFVAAPPDTAPVITFQPIDQTNYPGYPVNLVADATSNPEADWQWYKVGSGMISGATSRDYVPTNSGTAAVAGSYYAIADNGTDSASTRTAIVTFVSAPLPPDWTKAFQTQLTGNFDNPRTNYGIATLVDASGNVYAANSFTGTNQFASATFIAGPGRFAAGLFKHTATGTALWGRAITNNGNGNSYPQCVAHAPGDGVYMSGVFLGTNYIGTNVLSETAGASLYLVRFDASGNVLWVRTFGGTNSQFQSYHQLVADPAGNVTISALGNNLVDFGTTNLVLDGQQGVLAQYDADGNLRWVATPSGQAQYLTYAAGRIYACFGGNETNSIGGLTNTTDRKYVLAALNATNGQAFWLQGVGSPSGNGNPLGASDDVPAVAVSSSNVFLTGTAWGPGADFGAVSVSWPETNRQYFARFDTNGTAELAISFGGTNVWPWAAVADATGNVYVTGDFNGYASFGDKTIGAARYGGIGDAFYGQSFLAKFDRDGNSLWVRQAQSETLDSFVNVRDVQLASDSVWICGFVNDYGDFGTNLANRVYGPVTVVGSPFGYLYYYTGGYLANVTESGTATALPVTLINPARNGANFQFSFQSQSGFTHQILYRTNLATGIWQTNSTVTGDGSITNITLPFSLFSPAKQGFIRVSTE